MLVEHNEYPITQDWEQKQGCRSLVFYCGGTTNYLLADAIRHQAMLEGKQRTPPPKPKRKVRR